MNLAKKKTKQMAAQLINLLNIRIRINIGAIRGIRIRILSPFDKSAVPHRPHDKVFQATSIKITPNTKYSLYLDDDDHHDDDKE